MTETLMHTTTLRIAADHAALAGHFPGRPVVPGVVVLDRVLETAEAWLGTSLHVRALQQAKFTTPLLPEQAAELELKLSDAELRFHVRRGAGSIAQGVFSIERGAAL